MRVVLRVVVILAILAAIYIGLDLAAQAVTEHQLAKAIGQRSKAAATTVSVDTLPFLYDLVVHGSVDDLDIRLTDVPVGGLDLARVDISAENVRIRRGALFSHRQLDITGVSSAEIKLTMTAAELSRTIGHQVTMASPDVVKISLGPLAASATIAVIGEHALTVAAEGVQLLDIDFSRSVVLPRCAMRLSVSDGAATLGCRVSPVPSSLVAAISGTS